MRGAKKTAKKRTVIITRIPGVEPGAVERAVTPEEVRVNDVTATPYPIWKTDVDSKLFVGGWVGFGA